MGAGRVVGCLHRPYLAGVPTLTIEVPAGLMDDLLSAAERARRSLDTEVIRRLVNSEDDRLPAAGSQAHGQSDVPALPSALTAAENAQRLRLLADLREGRRLPPKLDMTVEEMDEAIEEGRA